MKVKLTGHCSVLLMDQCLAHCLDSMMASNWAEMMAYHWEYMMDTSSATKMEPYLDQSLGHQKVSCLVALMELLKGG